MAVVMCVISGCAALAEEQARRDAERREQLLRNAADSQERARKQKEQDELRRQALAVEFGGVDATAAGTSTITGQAFLRTRGGEVRTAAGMEVIMLLKTRGSNSPT
jgi:hypothetical protein